VATVLRVMSHGTFGRQEEEQVPKVERVQSSDSVYREALHPYQLFSTGSYFGEWELVQTTVPRKTTARCVSEGGGVVLTLNKVDFKRLAEQFPQFGSKWKEFAVKRERWRARKEAAMTVARPYRQLAARTIQEYYRNVTRRRKDAVASNFAEKDERLVNDLDALVRKLFPSHEDAAANVVSQLDKRQDQMQMDLTTLTSDVRELAKRVDMVLNLAVPRKNAPVVSRV